MKKTMLTAETLDRFESLVKLDTLTDEQIKEVEHLAYCANMGANNPAAAWDRFAELVKQFVGIDLEALREEKGTPRTAEEITADIIDFFENNDDIFTECIEELDNYNGYLGDDRYYSMDELNEFYNDVEPSEILNRAYYGHDAETYTTNANGNKEYGEFNPNRDYFTYNGYGNLVSADYKDYSAHLDRYAIEAMSENRHYIDTIEHNDELAALFNELEAIEE